MANGHSPSVSPDAPLTLITLGGAALVLPAGNSPPQILLGPGKPLALLTYLALTHGHRASREFLLDLLWADLEPERARHALRQTIYHLRQPLGDGILSGTANELELGRLIRADRDDFLDAVDRGDLESAFRLYGGTFLPNLSVPGGAEFDDWVEIERGRLKSVFHRSAETLARRYLGGSRARDAQSIARRLKKEDPLSESARRLLIEALLAAQDTLSAQNEADELEAMLRSESRTADAATRSLLALVHQTGSIEGKSEATSLAVELIGREKIFSETLKSWTSAQGRPGRHLHFSAGAGLGKTRLLVDLATRLRTQRSRVLYLRCNPGERQIPYSFAAELARALVELPGAAAISSADAAALVALSPAVSARFSATPPDASSGDEALRRRTSALVQLIQAVSEEHPMVIMLDDMHWLDLPTRTILRAVLDHVTEWPVLLVTAARPSAASWLESDHSRIHHLAPLTADQVGQVLASLASFPDEPWARQVPKAIHQATGGSPLLVLETIQLALERNTLERKGSTWHCADPVRLAADLSEGSALRHRIASLEPGKQDLLLALALTGQPLTTGELARIMEIEEPTAENELLQLEQRGFVNRSDQAWLPSHDEIAERAREEAAPRHQAEMHGAVGRFYAAGGQRNRQSLLLAAPHLLAAGQHAELGEVFARWVAMARREGDGRRCIDLANQLLGESANDVSSRALVRSLPFWNRIRLTSGQRMASMIAMLVVIVALGGLAMIGSPPRPVETLMRFERRANGEAVATEVMLLANDTAAAGVILRQGRTRAWPIHGGANLQSIHPSPDGSSWAYNVTLSLPDSGVIDVFMTHKDSGEHRLTSERRDDMVGSWSPDGVLQTMVTARWSPPGSDDYDIAIFDPKRDTVWPLTTGRDYDVTPHWSPEGRRIAFYRRYLVDQPPAICVIPSTGTQSPDCVPIAPAEAESVIGWGDGGTLLALAYLDGLKTLIQLDLSSRSWTVVRRGVQSATLSPDGQWVAAYGLLEQMQRPAWYVLQWRSPREIHRTDMPANASLVWWPSVRKRDDLTRIALVAPPETLIIGRSHSLRVEGRNKAGNEVALEIPLTWTTSDSLVAVVDTAGVVHPRRTGSTLLAVTAGRWGSDSVLLTVTDRAAGGSRNGDGFRVLKEDWSLGSESQWMIFGSPAPDTARGPGGTLGFWNRGDGSFGSGAISRVAWDSREGLGVEAAISIPITGRDQWQVVSVGVSSSIDLRRFLEWDRVSGGPPVQNYEIGFRTCSFAYPDGEGPRSIRSIAITVAGLSEKVQVPPKLGSGNWFQIRLQIFPDGRCGLAINGEPVWRSQGPLILDDPMRIQLGYSSVDTRVLVGPLEVWQGVRDDIDWSILDRKTTPSSSLQRPGGGV